MEKSPLNAMKCFTAYLVLCSIFILGGFKSPSVATAEPKWGSLKITYGPTGISLIDQWVPLVGVQDPFADMPLNTKTAVEKGFQKFTEECSGEHYQGFRYAQKKDTSVTLLYDINGNIAGIQTSYAESQMMDEKDIKVEKWFKNNPMFIKEKSDGETVYTATAYFMNPDSICNKERALERFGFFGQKTEGIELHFKNGTTNVRVPSKQSELAKTHWTEGRCFPRMGMHYWYNTSSDMDCEYFQPFFLLYNKGELNAFGFVVFGHFKSSRFEYPPNFVLPLFIKNEPSCLYHVHDDVQPITTMHVYFDVPGLIDCIL